MSKAAKIAITIGLMVVWALLRSLLEYSDFPLPVLTVVFILIILGLWTFGKSPEVSETDRPINRVDSEKQSDVGGIVFSDEKERKDPLPHIQVKSESEPEIAKQIPPQRVPSNMNIDNLNKDYVISLLKEKCHPRQFMRPYDYEKVNIANRLFSSLNDDCSLENIKGILSEATEKLQVTIDTSQVVAELCKACSPEKFMDPYDAEKIAEANELYSKILANSLNIIELVKLKEEAINVGILVPSQSEAVGVSSTSDTSFHEMSDMDYTPKAIVNYWRVHTGERLRLSQYEGSELFFLEKENGDSWTTIAALRKTKGLSENGGEGSEYEDHLSSMIKYKIRRFNGALIEIKSGVISNIWECSNVC